MTKFSFALLSGVVSLALMSCQVAPTPTPVVPETPVAEAPKAETPAPQAPAHDIAPPAQHADAMAGHPGEAVYKQYCVACHGADGKLGLSGAKDLGASTLTLDERIEVITKGRKLMTPFGEVLTPEEIRAVAEYSQKLAPPK